MTYSANEDTTGLDM